MPEVTAFSPIAAGASLFDIALRTEIGGAVQAMHGQILVPMFLGYPNEDGSLRIVQMVEILSATWSASISPRSRNSPTGKDCGGEPQQR